MMTTFGPLIAANMLAHKCSVPIVYDTPERAQPINMARERIVIEHDVDEADAFVEPSSQARNAKLVCVRKVAYKATVYAKHPAQGAAEFEHRERLESIVDMFLCALREACIAQQRPWTPPRSGRWLVPADLKGSQKLPGAAYELKFTIDRGVASTDWRGNEATEKTIGTDVTVATTGTVTVSGSGSEPFIP